MEEVADQKGQTLPRRAQSTLNLWFYCAKSGWLVVGICVVMVEEIAMAEKMRSDGTNKKAETRKKTVPERFAAKLPACHANLAPGALCFPTRPIEIFVALQY